jgi:hypothetical protein
MVQEYEGYVKQMAAAHKKAGQPIYAVLSNFSGNRFEYTNVTYVMKFGDMGGTDPIRTALGDDAYLNLTQAMQRCMVSSVWYYAQPWDDVQIGKPGPGPAGPQYFLRMQIPIARGKQTEYKEYLKNEVKPLDEKAGVEWFRAAAPVFGGGYGSVITFRRLKNLAEIDGGRPQRRILGVEGAKAFDAKSQALTRGPAEITLMRARPGLSWVPGQ